MELLAKALLVVIITVAAVLLRAAVLVTIMFLVAILSMIISVSDACPLLYPSSLHLFHDQV